MESTPLAELLPLLDVPNPIIDLLRQHNILTGNPASLLLYRLH